MNNLAVKPPKSWTTIVRCRSKALDLRLEADNLFPNWGTAGERISLFFHLKRIFLLDVESVFRDPTRNQRKGKAKRFWGFIGKLFGGWDKGRRKKKRNKKSNSEKCKWLRDGNSRNEQCWYDYQAPMVPLMSILSLLSHSSAQRDHKGITIHAFSYLFCLFILIGSVKRTCISSIFIPVIISVLGFYSTYWNYFGIASSHSHLGWNWAFASLVLSQLISFIRSISLEKRKVVIIFIASVPVLLYKFRREIIYQIMKIALFSSRAWFSGLLLTAQTLFHIVFQEKKMNYGLGVWLSSAYFWGQEITKYFEPFFRANILDMIF